MVTIGYGPGTAWHGCPLMVWSNNSKDYTWTPCGARAGIAQAPHGNLKCFSYPTGYVRGPRGTRKRAVRRPYGHARELTPPEFVKIPHGRRLWPYGDRTVPVRSPHGLFTGCLWYLNPYGPVSLKCMRVMWLGHKISISRARVPITCCMGDLISNRLWRHQ